MNVTIVNRSGRAVPRAFLEKWVRLIDREAGRVIAPKRFRGQELVIAFVTSGEIKRLNKEFRGKNKATDVLSFEGDDNLGELAISPEVISKQARDHGLLVREELGYMVLHGFLHLLGYDHETSEADAKRMFKLQDDLFNRLLRKFQGDNVVTVRF